MINAMIIVSLTTAIGFFIGKYFHSKYVGRRLFYEGLDDFIVKLEQNLSFKQESFAKFINDFKSNTNKVFSLQLERLAKYVDNGVALEIVDACDVKNRDKVKGWLLQIGTVDVSTQKNALLIARSEVGEMKDVARREERCKGVTCLKIGALVGFAVGILLI